MGCIKSAEFRKCLHRVSAEACAHDRAAVTGDGASSTDVTQTGKMYSHLSPGLLIILTNKNTFKSTTNNNNTDFNTKGKTFKKKSKVTGLGDHRHGSGGEVEGLSYLSSSPGPSPPGWTECHRLRPAVSHSLSSDCPERDSWWTAVLWEYPPRTLQVKSLVLFNF